MSTVVRFIGIGALACAVASLWVAGRPVGLPATQQQQEAEAALPLLTSVRADAVRADDGGADARVDERVPRVEPGSTRVRVVVRVAADAFDLGRPVPELLRLDEHGNPWRVAALGSQFERASGEVVREFEVDRPGRYVAAWHLWLQVPGTRVRRACRGRGPEIVVAPSFGQPRELVVSIGRAELELDPALDARPSNANTTLTAKDG